MRTALVDLPCTEALFQFAEAAMDVPSEDGAVGYATGFQHALAMIVRSPEYMHAVHLALETEAAGNTDDTGVLVTHFARLWQPERA